MLRRETEHVSKLPTSTPLVKPLWWDTSSIHRSPDCTKQDQCNGQDMNIGCSCSSMLKGAVVRENVGWDAQGCTWWHVKMQDGAVVREKHGMEGSTVHGA